MRRVVVLVGGAVKLGKRAPRVDHRTFALATYLTHELPQAPAQVDWTRGVPNWPVYRNDEIGDCTIASAGHQIEAWSAAAKRRVAIVDDAAVVKMYSAVSGYDPADPTTDNGAVCLDVLNYWRRTGLAGHRIGAFASVSPHDRTLTRDAVYLFGGVYLGLALPISAQGQVVWDVPIGGAHGRGAPGSWGGHAVPVVRYDERFLYVVTWGAVQRMTWPFYRAYTDEAYAIISSDFLTDAGRAPNGFDVATLRTDLSRVSVPG